MKITDTNWELRAVNRAEKIELMDYARERGVPIGGISSTDKYLVIYYRANGFLSTRFRRQKTDIHMVGPVLFRQLCDAFAAETPKP